MTIDQATAILEAERILQNSDFAEIQCEGPYTGGGSAWLAYVKEADRVVQGDPLFRHEFDDLALLQRCSCSHGCDRCGKSCKYRD